MWMKRRMVCQSTNSSLAISPYRRGAKRNLGVDPKPVAFVTSLEGALMMSRIQRSDRHFSVFRRSETAIFEEEVAAA
jgi:hypothetical protein